MKRICPILFCWVCILFNPLKGQTLQDSIIAHFEVLNRLPKEKLYLHLDKAFYSAGENIWFKGYLQDGSTHKATAVSNFILTELINQKDFVIQRKKIRKDSLGFHGNFLLPPELSAGNYYLRGYSNWMLNSPKDFLYSRNLRIGNPIDVSIQSSIEYEEDERGRKIGVLKFINQNNEPFINIKIRYAVFSKKGRKDKGIKETDGKGEIKIPFSETTSDEACWLDIAFVDKLYNYTKTFYLPVHSIDYDITFFPEGGDLLNLPAQNVAFKVQGADGFSKEMSGVLYNSKGDTLTTLISEHDGMGSFSFSPLDTETYYVESVSEDNLKKRFQLPTSGKTGLALSLMRHRGDILYQIQKTKDTQWPEELFLLAHTRGKLTILKRINSQNIHGKISDEIFSEGISHFLLIDEKGLPLSERLLFIRHEMGGEWTATTDREEYEARDKVTVEICGKNKQGLPLTGEFSVSITDASVPIDSLGDNILSTFLLTSDIKGYVENPGFYFQSIDKIRERYLDLVMLSHGWRRFNVGNLKQIPVFDQFKYYIERGQTISGKIKRLWGGSVKTSPVMAMAPQYDIMQTAMTNERGEFLIDNVSFPDSTLFILQARSAKGFAQVDILVDSTFFPCPANKSPYRADTIPFFNDYLTDMREKYYNEGGMQIVNLKEVVVAAQRKKKKLSEKIYSGMADNSVDSEDIEQMGAHSVFDVLSRMPGLRVLGGNQIRVRDNQISPAIIINGVMYDDDSAMLDAIMVEDVEQIDVLKGGNANIFGMRGAGGAIVIGMKRTTVLKAKPTPGILTISPMGYSKCAEFYHPKYDTSELRSATQSDIRTTLYWNPAIALDENGVAVIEYYTSDNSVYQNIVIEGLDKDGNPYRYTGKLYD